MPRPNLIAVVALAFALAGQAWALPQYGSRGAKKPPAAPADAPAAPAGDKPATKGNEAASEAKMYERLDKEDREALQANVGYLIPDLPAGLDWIGGEAWKREDFRGKVTVIQAFGGKAATRGALDKVQKALPEGTSLLALHTPEGADRAKTSFSNNPPCTVVVDADGAWCDALGVFRRPVNIVIDKTGAVRYVGLSDAGLKAKLPPLLAEEVDDSVEAREKPAAGGGTEKKAVAWPEFLAPIDAATDQRGKAAPGLIVDSWFTSQPTPGNRLVAIDFWATWCGPCKQMIPHVNELNQKYGNDVMFMGLSDETKQKFTAGLKSSKLGPGNFTYALALDPQKRLSNFFAIRGIPHMAIISPDGIVRWQGHPASLTEADLDKLVAANRANTKGGDAKPRTWAAAKAQKSR